MGYDLRRIELSYTDRKIINDALSRLAMTGGGGHTSGAIRNVMNKLRWAENERPSRQV